MREDEYKPRDPDSQRRPINEEREPLASRITGITSRGLSVFTAALFVVGEMAGSGILALPQAVLKMGWIGIILLFLCSILTAYTGITLGRCWSILQERFEIYRQQTRYPYPAIGYETFGKPGRYAVTFCVNATLFGGATVFLLLASDNIQILFSSLDVSVSFCAWLPIVSVCLLPLTWLGTPKDFWLIALIAVVATAVTCLFTFTQILLDKKSYLSPTYPPSSFFDFFFAFGVMAFANCGHAAFPTIQHDMQKPHKFSSAISTAYIAIVVMYIPVATAGYLVYGDKNQDNVLNVLSKGFLQTTSLLMMTFHLGMAFVIVINPLCQEVEEFLGIATNFSIKRIINRTVITGTLLFVAETLPHFSAVLSLVGGSTVTLLTFVFPSMFYLKLHSMSPQEGADWQATERLPLYQKVIHLEVILIGLIGGASSTYSAVYQIASGQSHFTVPCYVNATAAHI